MVVVVIAIIITGQFSLFDHQEIIMVVINHVLSHLRMRLIFYDNNEDMDYDDVDDHADQHYDDYDNISQRRSLQRTAMCKTPSSSLSSSKPGFLSLCFVFVFLCVCVRF